METLPRMRDNWFDKSYVEEWLDQQEARSGERQHQFAMVRSLIPRSPDEPFRYLNIGSGDGHLDECILARFPRAEATLLDGSAVMLDCARERLRAFCERVTFAQADLRTDWTSTVQGPFDLAVSTIAIHNLREGRVIRKVYADLYALLADGAFFVNLDYIRATHPSLSGLASWAIADGDTWPFARPRGGGGASGSIEEQLIWLREAGFGPVDCFWREFQVALFGGFKQHPQVPEHR